MADNLENKKTEEIVGKLKKRDLIRQYNEELEKLNQLPDSDSESDEEIELKPVTPKRERSEAQKLAFQKAQKTREEKTQQRKLENEQLKKEQSKVLENKLIKKAIDVKKKQIKEISRKIEEESDEEEEIYVKKVSNYNTPKIVGGKTPQLNPPLNREIIKEKPKYSFI